MLVGCDALYSQFGNGYIPYNVIIDPTGVLRYGAAGFNASALHALIGQYMVLDHPAFQLADLVVLDGDDGRPEEGESVQLLPSIENSGIAVPAWNLQLEVACDDPGLSWSSTTATLEALEPGQSAVFQPALAFSVDEAAEPRWATLQFSVSAEYADGVWEQSFSRELRLGRPDLLVVDADGSFDDNETFATSALNSLGRAHDLWSVPDAGELPVSEALAYGTLVWLGGRDNADLSTGERATLAAFLERGGLLLLSTQYGGNAPAAAPFLEDWFDVQVQDAHAGNLFLMRGNDEDPWFGQLDLVLTGSAGANNLVDPDRLALGPDAHLIGDWTQGAGGHAAAWRTGPGWRAIYCGFPIEAMRTYGALPNSVSLAQFFERVFAFDAAHAAPPEPVQASLSWQAGELRLDWSASPDAAAYRVYGLVEPWGADTLLAQTNDTTLTLPADGAGWLRVRAVR